MVMRHRRTPRSWTQGKNGCRGAVPPATDSAAQERRPRIGPDTPYGVCTERLSGFGGLLALEKFLDLVGMEDVFAERYVSPERQAKLGCYRMMKGFLMMLFIGFQRVGHVEHIRNDPMVCGSLKVAALPAASTFWRYLQSLGRDQSQSLLRLGAGLRARVWALIGFQPKRVSINMDPTASTVYGDMEQSCRGYNPKHRGKKALRPVLCFIEQTREYLLGEQRRGKPLTEEEVAGWIGQFGDLLPSCVVEVLVRGDSEIIAWRSVKACILKDYDFIFASRRCTPPFPKQGWYQHGPYEYNECLYQPQRWEQPCRFVAMRMPKEEKGDRLLPQFEDESYVYRVFVTNLTLKPHHVVAEYDPRASVENLIGEAQREGIQAIPSRKFQANHAYFQIVMLAYNLWRWIKLLAGHQQQHSGRTPEPASSPQPSIVDATLRMARLKMLYVAAKVVSHGNRDTVYYSIHEARAVGLIAFLTYLDRRRSQRRPWP